MKRRLALAAFLCAAIVPARADGALYWWHGVRSRDISVCFVGDALNSRAARVQQVLTYIKEYEYAANIHFNSTGTCAPATTQPNGNDFFAGDVRVVLPNVNGTTVAGWQGVGGTGPVPGKGCAIFRDANGNYTNENNGWGSWSNAPDDLEKYRSCLYNLKLGDDAGPSGVPYLNHTLHEFGHALGLAHEHERNDVDPTCTASGYGGSANSGFITPYDRNSVMHYQFTACGINGNYGYSGLSTWDQLAVHILYPEDDRAAEYVGTTVVRTTDTITLVSAWQARGANMSFVASDFAWTVAGSVRSTSPSLTLQLPNPGNYSLHLSHKDFLGRTYSTSSTLRVLTPAGFAAQVAGPIAARLPLM
jgi:hypothetical protein